MFRSVQSLPQHSIEVPWNYSQFRWGKHRAEYRDCDIEVINLVDELSYSISTYKAGKWSGWIIASDPVVEKPNVTWLDPQPCKVEACFFGFPVALERDDCLRAKFNTLVFTYLMLRTMKVLPPQIANICKKHVPCLFNMVIWIQSTQYICVLFTNIPIWS